MSDRYEQGDRLSARDVNRLVRGNERVARLSASRGVSASVGPQGLTIAGPGPDIRFKEPALVCRAANTGSADLNAYSACGIAGIVGGGEDAQRVLKVRVPTADDIGFFAVCAEPIAAGDVGRVHVMGACLALIRNENQQFFCDAEDGQQSLLGAESGGAQILWEESFAGAAPHLALIRFPFGGAAAAAATVYAVRAARAGAPGTPCDGVALAAGDMILVTSGADAGVHQYAGFAFTKVAVPLGVFVAEGSTNKRRAFVYDSATAAYLETYAGILG